MDSGYFVDQVLPLYGVRLISVSDGFDSADYKGNTGGIDISFKFLMHEYYSQDLSMKIKSAKRLQMKRGEMIMAGAPYGYRKINGKWEPDGVASEVVRKIYDYALNGFSSAEIRDKLCAEKILTPREYIDLSWGKEVFLAYLWSADAVTRILTNEQYKGTYISGRHEQSVIGTKRLYSAPKSEWIILPNRHTPIIAPEVFDKVQELLKRPDTRDKLTQISNCAVVEHKDNKWLTQIPYGYRKKSSDACEIDEISSAVVRKIFDLALQGKSESEIAEILTAERCLTPGDYKLSSSNKPLKLLHKWQAETVRMILRKVRYTGVHVSGRWYTGEDGKKCITPESDREIIPGALPVIISEETYKKVADIMASREVSVRTPRNHLLRSVVKCGCCGRTMKYARQLEPMYRCYFTIADSNAECYKSEISVEKLEKVVMTVIRKRAELVLKTADLSKLRRKSVDERKISDVENEIAQSATERQQQYERFVLGEITRDEYAELKADCAKRLERLNRQLDAMKSEIDASKVDPRAIAVAKAALSDADNNRELVEALIKTVKVYPNNRVDIDWKIAGFGSAE